MPTLRCRAVIFDLDGVLIDSNALYEAHWVRWATDNKIDPRAVLSVHHGRPVASTIRAAAPHLDANAQAATYKARLDTSTDLGIVTAFPGALALLRSLPVNAWAIATSAPGTFARKLMRQLGLPWPTVLITGDDVARGKPDPMPYLHAARALGVRPDQCLVVEDAPAGVASARAAGSHVLGVLTTNRAEALQGAHALTKAIGHICVRAQPPSLYVRWEEAER